MSLVPAAPRTDGPAHGTTVAAAVVPARRPGGHVAADLQVARTADLVFKLHRLLERAQLLEEQPERTARMARLAWAVEHGQAALRQAAAQGPGDPAPSRPG